MDLLRIVLVSIVCSTVAVMAAEDDARARALLNRAGELSRTTRHWDDREQTLGLEIVDRRGGRRQRRLEMWTKRYPEDASRTTLIFREPAQARGVGFLQWVDPHGPDSQWLYLPASKRVRQITGSRKKDSFVGTDFSYEDLGLMMDVLNWSARDAVSTWVREETVDESPCTVIELEPSESQEVSYSRLRIWLGVDDYLIYRYQFFDDEGQVKKNLVLADFKEVGGIPAPHRLEMFDVLAGSRTVATVEALEFDVGLRDEVFTKRRLERGS